MFSREIAIGNKMSTHSLLVVFGLILGAFPVAPAVAGFVGLPLKAQLDLAQTVAVGKIIAITPEKGRPGDSVVFGRATVAVSQVLKGQAGPEIAMTVVVKINPERHDLYMQSPSRQYCVGDEGIWVIMPNGQPYHLTGLLDIEHLAEVKALLAELDNRVWSEEVDGLKAWASVAAPAADPFHVQRVIFAIMNVSKSTIWVPYSSEWGVVTAVARDSAGKDYDLHGFGKRVPTEGPIRCHALKPGETRYMHPVIEDYGFFIIPKDLPPGKYTVTVTLANTRDNVVDTRPAETQPVTVWKGKVAAPSFILEIPEPSASQPTRE